MSDEPNAALTLNLLGRIRVAILMEYKYLQARGDLGLQMNYAFVVSSFPSAAQMQLLDP